MKLWNFAGPAAAIQAAQQMTPPAERCLDHELLQRFRAGDRDAFTAIYRAHQTSVYRFARFMTGDETKAAEVTQDVFVWLIHHPGQFDPERGGLGGFLVGVTRYVLKRRFTEERRWVPIEEAEAVPLAMARESSYDTELLRQAVAALPVRYREVVALCGLEGRSYEECAGIIGCAVGTVRSRMHRARALLARKLVGKGCPA
jgi:RNA polymerase sigma-70 factor (ECF subfamily)